jgi:hypothetical protein
MRFWRPRCRPAPILAEQRESVDPIAVTVPVSGRRPGGGPAMGNMVSPMLVDVATVGDVGERLKRVETAVKCPQSGGDRSGADCGSWWGVSVPRKAWGLPLLQ